MYVLYLALHAYAVNSTDSPFLQGSQKKATGLQMTLLRKPSAINTNTSCHCSEPHKTQMLLEKTR